jgi:hypothetical protein
MLDLSRPEIACHFKAIRMENSKKKVKSKDSKNWTPHVKKTNQSKSPYMTFVLNG